MDFSGELIKDRYRITDKIGEGGMSIVYAAEDDSDKKARVAVKILKSDKTSSRLEDLIRFYSEASTVSRLSHEHIVRVHEVGEQNGLHFIVMDYIDGISLAEAFRQNRKFTLNECLRIMEQSMSALEHVHQRNILHRDIKPGNIMCRFKGAEGSFQNLKLIDFGLAQIKEFRETGTTDEIIGTFCYMSPEQSGMVKRKTDERSDLYSLGILFYRLFAGELPFTGKDANSIIHQHVARLPSPISNYNKHIPPTLEKMIHKLIEKEPESRYQTATGFLNDIRKFRSGESVFEIGEADHSARLSYRSAMVGRDRELEKLKELYYKMRNGEGGVCFVTGEAGIGKARLVEEFGKLVIARRGVVLDGKCASAESKTPYAPIREALGQYASQFVSYSTEKKDEIRSRFTKNLSDLSSILVELNPALEAIFETGEKPVALESERESKRFLMVVTQFLIRLSQIENGLVFVISGAQWADESTLALMEEIAREIAAFPLLLVVTFRDSETSFRNRMLQIQKNLGKTRVNIAEIRLKPLECQSIQEMLAHILMERSTQSSELANLLYPKSRGNPLFAVEALKQLIDNHALKPVGTKWRIDKKILQKTDISSTILDIILRRIELLDSSQNDVLTHAAAIGRNFDMDTLFELAKDESYLFPVTDQDIVAIIDRALELQLLERDQSRKGVMTFAHERIREAFYHNIEGRRKRSIILNIVRMVEKRAGRHTDRYVFDLARYYVEAGEREKAVEYLIPAAEKSRLLYANEDAIDFYKKAVEFIDETDFSKRELRLKILEELGALQLTVGRIEDAVRLFEEILPQRKDRYDKARIYQKLCLVYQKKGDLEKNEKYGRLALRELQEYLPGRRLGTGLALVKDLIQHFFHVLFIGTYHRQRPAVYQRSRRYERGQLMIAVYISLSWGYIRGDLFKFIRTTLRMLNVAESELGLSKELGMSIGAFASLLMAIPSFQRAIYYHKRALEMRRELQDEWGVAQSLQWLAYCMQWKGDFEESNRLFFDSISRFQKIGDLWEKGMNEQGIEMNYIYLGQYEDAMNYLHNYLRTCEQIDDVYGITGAYVDFQWLNTERGDFTMTKKWAEKAIDLSIANKIYFSLANSFCYSAEQYILEGNYRDAVGLLLEAKHLHEKYRFMDQYVAQIYPNLAEAYLGVSKTTSDRRLRRQYLRKADKMSQNALSKTRTWTAHYAKSLRSRALVLAEKGQNRLADKFFQDSVKHGSLLRREFEVARSLYCYGLFLIEASQQKDGRLRLESAYRIFRKIHSNQLMIKTAELLGIRDEDSSSSLERLQYKHRFASIIEISQDITSILDPGELLERILARAIEITGAQRGYLFLWDEESASLHIRAEKSVMEETARQYSGHVVDKVFRTGEPLITTNAEQDETLFEFESIVVYNLKSILCVPVRRKEKTVGVCYLDNPLSSSVFTEEDLELMRVIMSQAAIAIENASLYSDLEKRVEERTRELNHAYSIIKTDLGIAKRIQENLLPGNLDKVGDLNFHARFYPMSEVGGDFYDVKQLSKDLIRVFIADATGHGVQGAMITMLIKGEYERLKPIIKDVNELLEILNNEIFYTYRTITVFFTCFIADIDLAKGKLRYASAGHPSQYLLSGDQAFELPSTGKMSGIFPATIYGLNEIEYAKGDKLFLFTDGLFEEFNPDEEEFGEERIAELIRERYLSLSPSVRPASFAAVMDDIIGEVNRFRKTEERNDDMTCLLIE